jgi:hypothetical protein
MIEGVITVRLTSATRQKTVPDARLAPAIAHTNHSSPNQITVIESFRFYR